MKEETHQTANAIQALIDGFVRSADVIAESIRSKEPLTAHRRDQIVAIEDAEPDRQIPDEDGGL